MKNIPMIGMCGLALTLTLLAGCGEAHAAEKKDQTSKTAESSVVTNDNGSVSRIFTESSVTTNGNMVTEHRRETRTSMDKDGNVLETSTSEYAQSYNVGDTRLKFARADKKGDGKTDVTAAEGADSFLGLQFGKKAEDYAFIDVKNLFNEANGPTAALLKAKYSDEKPIAGLYDYDADAVLLRAKFTPAATNRLEGFDDYYVYVTPKDHKIVKICACAKNSVEVGARGKRHYLIEALEKRYDTWARLLSWFRPLYAFDVASGRQIQLCLAGASPSYQTVISAYDGAAGALAVDEYEEILKVAREKANENRKTKVDGAFRAF